MKLTPLQITLIVIIALVLIFIFLLMTDLLPGLKPPEEKQQTVEFWSTEPQELWQNFLRDLQQNKKLKVVYKRLDQETYIEKVVNAQAAGKGPDVWILSGEFFTRHADKIQPAPKELIPLRIFTQMFPDIALNYVTADNAIWGIPARIDPLVLYWNKNLFNNAAIPQPPKTWSEFIEASMRLTKRGQGTEITTAGAALGVSSNIAYAKEIVSMLLLQAGNPIINTDTKQVTLGQTQQIGQVSILPAQSIMRFFSDFANQGKSSYSWNASFPEAQEAFISEQLALFLGFASDYEKIKKKNPHLNFDVVSVPQIEGGSIKTTYANVFLFVVSRNSKNSSAAWRFIQAASGGETSLANAREQNFVSPRRDLIDKYEEPHLQLFSQNLLFAKTWNQPDPEAVSEIFTDMIELVHSNEALIVEAIRNAQEKLQILYRNEQEKFK